ncbi:chromosomal replication initiator protein DnaA [Isosphaeraceae bacterium EP7]
MADLAGVETTLRAAVAERLGEAKFGLWFGDGVRFGVEGDSLDVAVPSAFSREWIQGHFAENLIEAGHAVTGRTLRLDVRVRDEAEPRHAEVIDPTPIEVRPTAPSHPVAAPSANPPKNPGPNSAPRERPRGQGRPGRKLDDFVAGPGNKLALAAAREAVVSEGASFNPLVLHGGVGLGKTHLLEGIAGALRQRHPGLKVVHLTAEGFTNDFLDAMRSGTLPAFRARYRGAGALIVDDVHFLAAKRATQDEFLHTFNALVAEGALVVMACDQHPRQIPKLSDELATRFVGGMVVKLDAPDPVNRRGILKAKAAARGVDVPDVVIAYIAEHVRSSVRELEGALHSLIAHALLVGRRIDLTLARTALRDTIRHTSQAVALKDVERVVCQLFQVEAEALRSSSRAHAVTYPRMIAMTLARKHAGAAYSEIGRFFGGRNHSTVIAAEKKVNAWMLDARRVRLLAGFESVADIFSSLERTLGI